MTARPIRQLGTFLGYPVIVSDKVGPGPATSITFVDPFQFRFACEIVPTPQPTEEGKRRHGPDGTYTLVEVAYTNPKE